MSQARTDVSPSSRALVLASLWLGLASGLVEGVGWMVMHRFDRLTTLWTGVMWIAPILNGLLFLLGGLLLVLLLRVVPSGLIGGERRAQVGAYVLALAVCGHLAALVFQSFVHPVALLILVIGGAAGLSRLLLKDVDATFGFFERRLPLVAALVVVVFVGVQGYAFARERMMESDLADDAGRNPDVVVVVIDALRADRVSAYGNPNRTSPFIDELADEGVLFETAMSASPYTLPSHASMLSGLDPHEHGVEWLDFNVFGDSDYPSVAESFLDLGYRTGAFSANPFWFTREQGYGRGFIRFEDFYHNAADMAYRTVFGKVFEKLVMPRIGWENVPARKEATESTDRVLNWVRKGPDRPFFAFVNYFDVHDPYVPPQPYRGRFSDQEAPGGILNWRLGRGEEDLSPAEIQSELEAYDGALAYVDDELRRLRDEIRTMRPDRELIFIITSDHGEAFGEHGAFLHGKSLYREEIHIPLVVWAPGRTPPGLRIDRPVTHSSIPATALELAVGSDAPKYGAPSLVGLWADSTAAEGWPYPLAEMGQRDWVDQDFKVAHGDIQSLVSPEYQYISYDTLPHELFRWSDVLQADDVSSAPELTDVLEDFRARLPSRDR